MSSNIPSFQYQVTNGHQDGQTISVSVIYMNSDNIHPWHLAIVTPMLTQLNQSDIWKLTSPVINAQPSLYPSRGGDGLARGPAGGRSLAQRIEGTRAEAAVNGLEPLMTDPPLL